MLLDERETAFLARRRENARKKARMIPDVDATADSAAVR